MRLPSTLIFTAWPVLVRRLISAKRRICLSTRDTPFFSGPWGGGGENRGTAISECMEAFVTLHNLDLGHVNPSDEQPYLDHFEDFQNRQHTCKLCSQTSSFRL